MDPPEGEAGLLRQILDGAPDAVISIDAGGRITGWNPMAEQTFGWAAGEVMGRRLADTVIPERLGTAHEHGLQRYLKTGEGPLLNQRSEVVARRKDGVELPVELTLTPLHRGADVTFSAFLRDISERRRAEAALRAQKDLFANVVAVARALTERPTLEATLEKAFDVLKEITGAEGGNMVLMDARGQARVSLLGDRAIEVGPEQTHLVMEKGLAGWVARERKSALVPDAARDDRVITLPVQRFRLGSAASVPIVRGTRLAGVVTLVHSARGHFREEHLEFLEAAADQLGLAVANAQFVEALQGAGERQSLLYEVLRSAAAQHDPDAALAAAVDAMARQPTWARVAIAVPDGGGLRMRASTSPQGAAIAETAAQAFATGKTRVARDGRCRLAVPLRRGGDRLGVLTLESDARDAFGPDDVLLAESLADNVALALDQARLHQDVAAERERLQAVIRSSRDGVLLVGTDGLLLLLNDTALRLLDRPGPGDPWLGRPLAALLAEVRPEPRRALEAAAEVKAPGSAPRVGGYEGTHVVRCLSHGVASRGASLGRLIVLRDVTAEKKLERLREDLTRTMVHDLRGPLTVMLSSLEIMRTQPEAQPRMLACAQQAAEAMRTLVDGILDISRLEEGSFPLERRRVALDALVRERLDLASPVAAGKNLVLRSTVPATLSPAWADPAVVGRVVWNLVHNALKFTPAGGEVQVGVRDADPGWLCLSVEDTGPGLPADLRSRLFQKFAAGSAAGCGTGLGLAFCRLAVEAHGGRIWVEDEAPAGTRFLFTLPAYPPADDILA